VTSRLDVTFPSGGQTCAAWLYRPPGGRPAPIVILGHGFGATRGMRLDAFAERFVDAGYACLVFDYRHFGDSEGEPRQLLDIDRQLSDWAAAIAYARSRPELDPERVMLWGSSFGGGHVLVTAARDKRVAAAIAQCPFTDGPASALAMGPLSVLRVALRSVPDVVLSIARLGPIWLAVVGKPGSGAMLTAPDVLPGFASIAPEGTEFVNRVAARIGFHALWRRPGRSASRVACPVLFCVCEHDSLAPAKTTLRHAGKAPQGEVALYPIGHFDVYVGEGFERVVADQIAFLKRHVPAG
jgi:pimeloyl-ACP methyl ester carboxylesterase